jgi:dihydroorotate dehydrogenase
MPRSGPDRATSDGEHLFAQYQNLRDLQSSEKLDELLAAVMAKRPCSPRVWRTKPLLVKVAPDCGRRSARSHRGARGEARDRWLIATNTTIGRERSPATATRRRPGLERTRCSSRPRACFEASRAAHGVGSARGVGGILSGEQAREKIEAGASLVQLYTGFIYRGPALIGEARRAIAR